MRDGTRAALSAAMLAGFLAIAWLQVGAALLVVFVVLKLMPGSVAVRVAVPLTIATGGLLWYATVRALRLRHRRPAGVPVTRQDAPALWSMIDVAAGAAGVAPPDGVTVVANATATLAERVRFGGLAGGRRELLLGMPLLLAWDTSRLRAVVAHELAHGSPRLGRLAPTAYRGRITLGRIVKQIPRRSPAGPLLRAYAAWYRRVDAPFSRAQELAADRIAASVAGEHVAAAVLHDAPALDGMQRLFHAEYLSPGWQAGYAPVDVFGGFLQVLAARPEEVARLRALDPEPPTEWDTHPAVADRITALAQLAAPEQTAVAGLVSPTAHAPSTNPAPTASPGAAAGAAPAEPAAAGDLVPDLPGLARALQAVAFPASGREVVSWDEFFSIARIAEMEREADASLRALSRAAGSTVTGPAEVLGLAADGRLRKIAETVFGDLPAAETAERITDLITLLLALAALHSGVARWRHSWMGTAELVAMDGSHLDLGSPAMRAADPATVDDARGRLAALGIDLGAHAGEGRPARVPVLGGVVNLVVDGARTDLLVVETGLVLLPGLPRSRHAEARRRLSRLAAEGILADGSIAVRQSPPLPRVPGLFVPSAGPGAGSGIPSEAPGVDGASTTDALPADGTVAPAAPATAGTDAGATTALAADARPAPAKAGGIESRFVRFVDVAGASVVRNGRRGWEFALRDGRTMNMRAALDSDELPGGWTAVDDVVAFLARTAR